MSAYVVVAIALAGLLLYVLASNPKLVEIGRIMLFCGLLALCFALSRQTIKLF
jgi:Na+/phosphate symporter